MSLPLSWGEITHKVEHSGQKEQEQQTNDTKKRNIFLRADWQDQIQQQCARKMTEEKEKPHLRAHAEMMDVKAHEKQKRLKNEAKSREFIYRNQNMEIIEKHRQIKNDHFQNQYLENPLTSSITNKYDERNKKSREKNIQYNQINNQLIQQKELLKKMRYDLEYLERQRFQSHVEQTFKRKDEERYAFKKACLDGRKKKVQSYVTAHDSLEKEYAMYLNEQIAEKKNLTNQEMAGSRMKNMNRKAEQQNSSPAYLGRIPINHDRQKQLSYLDRQLKFRQRIKTQNPSISFTQNPEQVRPSKFPQINQYTSCLQPIRQLKPIPRSNSNQRDNQTEMNIISENNKKSDMRQYRQLNILTGSHIVRSHYL